MEFLEFQREIQSFAGSNKSYIVVFESQKGLLCEYLLQNSRQLIDIIKKVNALPTITGNDQFLAIVVSSFAHQERFYILYQWLEKTEKNLTQDEILYYFDTGVASLMSLKNFGISHGEISPQNLINTTNGLKLIGFKLPEPRSFDKQPQIQNFQKDIQDLAESLLIKYLGQNWQELSINIHQLDTIRKIALGSPFIPHEQNKQQQRKFIDQPATNLQKYHYVYAKQKKVALLNTETFQSQITSFKIPLGRGFSISFGQYIYLTGGQKSQYMCFLIDPDSLQIIYEFNLKSPHYFHSSIYFNSEFWVVSGINSTKTEKLSNQAFEWGPSLNKVRQSCSLAVYNGILYVFSKGVERMVNLNWEVLPIDFEWTGCVGIVKEDKILVLGGREISCYNSDIEEYRIQGELIKFPLDFTGLFGCFGIQKVQYGMVVSSNIGKLCFIPTANPILSRVIE